MTDEYWETVEWPVSEVLGEAIVQGPNGETVYYGMLVHWDSSMVRDQDEEKLRSCHIEQSNLHSMVIEKTRQDSRTGKNEWELEWEHSWVAAQDDNEELQRFRSQMWGEEICIHRFVQL